MSVTYTTRQSSSWTTSIDAVLKDLKRCTKALSLAAPTFFDECRVLERLYYKGRNQHRSALFWKRVQETRRYAGRLNPTVILGILENFHSSFYAGETDKKKLKGPWTHYANVEFFATIVVRLSGYQHLAEKMHERLQAAYRSLSLMMRSGAFLQLILILIALISRLDTIVTELADALIQSVSVVQRAKQVLYSVRLPELQIIAPVQDNHSAPSNDIAIPSRHSQSVNTVIREVPKAVEGRKRRKKDEIDSIFDALNF